MFPIGVFIPLLPLHFLLLVHDVKAIAATKRSNKLIIFIFLIINWLSVYKTNVTNCVPIFYFSETLF